MQASQTLRSVPLNSRITHLEEDIADGAITSNKINDGIITSAVMVSEALTSRVLDQNSPINDDFGNNEIYSEHFQKQHH